MRSSSRSSDGTRNGMRACATLRRARSSRAAIVGSGTRNACAVCAVLRPPSDFTVSATRAGSASEGWQHAKRSRRRSSVREVASSKVGIVGRGDGGAVAFCERLERPQALVERAGASQPVDGPAPGGGRQPGGGDRGHAVARPGGQRDGVGVLQRVLGEREVAAEMADEGRQDARAVLAGGPLERAVGRQSKTTIGRTSTDPYVMFGILAAQASAASRSWTSIR